MSLENDFKQLSIYLDDWVRNNQMVDDEIILCVNTFATQQCLDINTKHNLAVAKHMISSEEFLQKMNKSFAEILDIINKMKKL